MPKATSECLPVDAVSTSAARTAQLVADNNFYACSADAYRPGQEGAPNDYQFLVCDPRECADDNYDYSDGCEAARQYDARWAAARKFGAINRAQQYWVRDDGAVTLFGKASDSAPPVSGTWQKIVDLATYTYTPVSLTLYGVAQSSSAFACSTAAAPSGTAFGGAVTWALDATDPGPWYHVSQQAQSTCTPGYNPGGTRADYSRVLKPRLCTDQSSEQACFDTWQQLDGHGKCALPCEPGWKNCDGDPSNGCESYLADALPYAQSRCGSLCDIGNYNLDGACGAGICLSCRQLGGVNHVAVGVADNGGGLSKCVDGGGAWDNSAAPVSAVAYPGDYYCNGVTDQRACGRLVLAYPCTRDGVRCLDGNLYSGATGAVSDRANAVYKPVCLDADKLWWTGCEVALLYNLRSTTEGPAKSVSVKGDNGLTYTLRGVYDRSVGVRPYYDRVRRAP